VLADAVLVTLPLGVMKRGSVAFSPPLPEYALPVLNLLVASRS
jgi:Flavin containing amine oxidoreductase